MNCDFGMASAGLTGHFGHFRGKSSQVPLHEPFTHKIAVFRSNLVKASQTKSKGLTSDSTTNRKWFPLQASNLPRRKPGEGGSAICSFRNRACPGRASRLNSPTHENQSFISKRQRQTVPARPFLHCAGRAGARPQPLHALRRRIQKGGFQQAHHRHRLHLEHGHPLQRAH